MSVSSVLEHQSSLRPSSFQCQPTYYRSQLPGYLTLIITHLTRATNRGMHETPCESISHESREGQSLLHGIGAVFARAAIEHSMDLYVMYALAEHITDKCAIYIC
jgi:hypothetical protein